MFNWVKKLFGTEKTSAVQGKYFVDGLDDVQEVVATTEPLVLQPEQRVDETPKPKKKTAPKKAATAKTVKHTKDSLEKLSKAEIDALAKSELDISLDRRKTKNIMIEDFLAAQKK